MAVLAVSLLNMASSTPYVMKPPGANIIMSAGSYAAPRIGKPKIVPLPRISRIDADDLSYGALTENASLTDTTPVTSGSSYQINIQLLKTKNSVNLNKAYAGYTISFALTLEQ